MSASDAAARGDQLVEPDQLDAGATSSIACQPSQTTASGAQRPIHSAHASASADPEPSRPASASATILATVSAASFLLVPITPLGPRLIHPTTYSPRRERPSSSQTRPPSLRIRPRRSSNGTSSIARPR
jgi:hypothetical protein